MPELPKVLTDIVGMAFSDAVEILRAVLVFVLFSILFNMKKWRLAIARCFPSSLRVNTMAFMFDSLLVAMPIGLLLPWLAWVAHTPGQSAFMGRVYEALPQWVVGFLVIFVGDLVGYFRHRLEHSPFLWPAHSLHHSDEQMTFFTLFRFHPLNRLTTVSIDLGVLYALGFPLWAIALNGLVRHYYGMFIHMNQPWTLGRFGRFFVSPAMHRWHHVREGQGIHKNFATVFSVFDRAFGTFYLPGPCDAPLGVVGTEHEKFIPQLMLPLTVMASKIRRSRSPTQATLPTTY